MGSLPIKLLTEKPADAGHTTSVNPLSQKKFENLHIEGFFILDTRANKCNFVFQLKNMNFQPILLGVLGTQEIILIVIAILILFGGRKIPELMRGVGKGIREFNDAKNNVRKEIEDGSSDTTPSGTK